MRSTRRPAIRALFGARLAAAVLLGMPALAAAQTPGIIERCRVIAQEVTDYNDETRLLLERFCELLEVPGPPAAAAAAPPADVGAPDYFVKCVVADDPDWIGFRLVTRQQCIAMRGEETARR